MGIIISIFFIVFLRFLCILTIILRKYNTYVNFKYKKHANGKIIELYRIQENKKLDNHRRYMLIKCPQCESIIIKSTKFCEYCGYKVKFV